MKIVCLTGMHRSGTSLVSRVVNLLGVDLGPEDELMPAKPDNPRGFWENSAISAVNHDQLAALGGRWNDPPMLDDGWEQSARLDELRARATAILQRLQDRDDAGPALAWKDPRNSLLAPFWRTVTPIDATILTVRHPAQVAASLATRDGLDSEASAHLWLRYLVAAWRADPKRLSIRFSNMFSDLDAEIDRIVEHLGLPQPGEDARRAIAEFVEPGLRHHVDAPVEPGPTMALAMTLFDMFEASPTGLDPVVEALHRMWLAENRLEPLAAERDVAVRHRDELIEERRVAVARGEELDRTIAEVAAHRDRLETEVALLRDDLVALEGAAERAAHLEARLEVQLHTIDQAERVAQALRRNVAARTATARELEAQVLALEAKLVRWRIDKLERVLQRLRLL